VKFLAYSNTLPCQSFFSSGLGVVPKHDGGCRALHSINDFIKLSSYSLTHCTIDDAYNIVNRLGRCVLLSKINLKKCIQINSSPEDSSLLGIH